MLLTTIQPRIFRGMVGRDARLWQSEELARYLIAVVMPAHPDGFTLDTVQRCPPLLARDAYVVSLHGHGRILKPPYRTVHLQRWLNREWAVLIRPEHYVGGWLNGDDGRFHLDVLVAVCGLETARAFGRANHQKAIYHPHSATVIKLDNAPCARPLSVDGTPYMNPGNRISTWGLGLRPPHRNGPRGLKGPGSRLQPGEGRSALGARDDWVP